MSDLAQKNPTRTLIFRMLIGMLIGAGGTALFLYVVGDSLLDAPDPGNIFAVVGGMSYALIGLVVGFGILAPTAGAKLLNVEDADELREERPKLRYGALACFLTGVFLLALATATQAPDGLIGREAALLVSGLSLAGVVIVSLISSKLSDELTRQINLEASTQTLLWAMLLFGGWAALAHLDYVPWATPLMMIALLADLQLVSIMVIAARKGLMMPR